MGVAVRSWVNRFELGHGAVHAANLARLQDIFEQRGVPFLPADEVGEGMVRLRGPHTGTNPQDA
jgi:hypothetical protein